MTAAYGFEYGVPIWRYVPPRPLPLDAPARVVDGELVWTITTLQEYRRPTR